MKRIFVIVLSVALVLVSAFCVSAEGVQDSRTTATELLQADVYEVSCQDGDKVWMNSSYDRPELYIAQSKWVQYTWDASLFNLGFESLYMTFKVGTNMPPPSTVTLYSDIYQGRPFDGYLVTNSNGIYQYKFTIGGTTLSRLSVKVEWEGRVSGFTQIMSLKGFKNEVFEIDSASYSYYHTFFQSNKIEQIQDDYGSNYLLPLTYHYEAVDYNDQIYMGRAFYYLSQSQRKIRNPDSVVAFINAIDDEAEITVSLVDTINDNRVVTVLPYTVERVETRHTYDKYVSGQSYQWPISTYQVVIDTSSYDLAGYTIQICVEVYDFTGSGGRAIWVQFDSAFSVPPVADLPWYRVFFGWISEKYDMLGDKLNNILAALLPDNSGFSEEKEKAQEKADEITEMNEFMASIPKADPGSEDIDFDMQQFLLPASASVTSGTVMTTILGPHSWVVTIFSIIFTLALVAYVFFGKR